MDLLSFLVHETMPIATVSIGAQVMDTDIGQIGLSLDHEPKTADFPHWLANSVTGEKPRIAARHDQMALPNNRYHVLRNRDAVYPALLCRRCWLRPNGVVGG